MTKRKLDKLDFTKIKNFCATSDAIKRVKDNPQNRENFASRMIQDLYPKYIKNSYKSLTMR